MAHFICNHPAEQSQPKCAFPALTGSARRSILTESLEYWNHYRVHEGIGGKMISPYPQDPDGEVVEVSFLGGFLHGYKRGKVAA